MNTTIALMKTLLQREWMQHKRGWLVLLTLPFVVLLLAATFGTVQFGNKAAEVLKPTPLAAMSAVACLAATVTLVWLAVLLQAGGLARRDVQDRSIEFWLSLPTPPSLSVATTLGTHLLLLPWLAVGFGLLGGLLLAPVVVVKGYGIAGLAQVQWDQLLVIGAALGVRVLAGLLMATMWLSPLILGLMAASAWLKRWGVPAVAGGLAVGGGLERLLLGTDLIHGTVKRLFEEAGAALIAGSTGAESTGATIEGPSELDLLLPKAMEWLLRDLLRAAADLGQPAMIAVLACSAGLFALLVLRRQRGG
jgi:ABC-2 type transport system permease protein